MVNPFTGVYTPFITYSSVATGGVATPIAPINEQGAVWNRAASSAVIEGVQYDFQNDWNYQFSTSFLKSDTTAGVAVTWYPTAGNRQGTLPANGGTKGPFDLYNFVGSTNVTAANASIPALKQIGQEIDQAYIAENLSFFKDRVILSGSISENKMTRTERDLDTSHPIPTPVVTEPNPVAAHKTKLLKGYGIVISPIPYAALYYGHSETSLPITSVNTPFSSGTTPNTAISTGFGVPATQDSKDDEAGIRFKTLDGRSTATVDYFQVSQSNNSIPNPANLSLAPGQAQFPLLFANVVSRGWEYEFNTAITPQLSILGTYTHFKIANAYGQDQRAVAQSQGSIYANYRFTSGSLKGFQAGVGVVHVSRKAVDTVSGSTPAGTATAPIPQRPSAYLPAYTVVNLTSSYQLNAQWRISAYVDNLFNEYYFTGALNRFNVFSGPQRGYRGSVTYSF